MVNIEGVTRPEADMKTGRLRPGIVYHYDSISVFVFGGSEDGGAPIKTAIKYSFKKPDNFLARRRPSGAWEQLSDMMHPRSHFNPCLFAGLIYIAGGGHPSIEAYDPPSGQTRGLIRSDEIDPDISLMVSHMDKLVLIGNARVFRRSYSNPQIEEKRDRIAGNALWSNMTPVVVEDAAYIVVMTGETITLLKLGVYTARVLVEKRYGEEVGNS